MQPSDPFPDGPYADALPRLETERLVLRPLIERDDPGILAIFSDGVALRTWVHPPFESLADARAYRAMLETSFDRRAALIWGVFEREGPLAGIVILTRWSANNRRVDLGYYLGSTYWGRGYATEAARGVLRWAFETLDVHRIEAEVVPGNEASARVLGRLGFQHEARLAERLWSGNEGPHDSELFRLFHRDFEG